ncbi:hypothetical protein OKW33_003365 [Paraburkholderia atlantica]|uniref:hypothetical protein n=1 Tax=Paraburkholderia TaxID=1822464 RepID=UPI00128BC164|nr:hypothetical protein [Paraburkholderia atlantica]MPW10108.1 hypothetical protein [Paraburkholderia atlantica]
MQVEALVFDGALYADGPFLPWRPSSAPEQLKQWQRELLAVVNELAKLENWADDAYDVIAQTIERQPASTLRSDPCILN